MRRFWHGRLPLAVLAGWSIGMTSALAQPAGSEPPLDSIPVDALPDTAPVRLETVEVQALRQAAVAPVNTSTGLDGATHAQPLSIVSISRAELEARGARDLVQALETVAAVNAPVKFQLQSQGSYDVRGFGATVLLDGFSSLGLYGDRDSLVGVERVDIVKGPGSAINSGALGLPPGGVIDIHSAWPGAATGLRAQYAGSRYGQREYLAEADSGDLIPVLSFGIAAQRGEGQGFFDFSKLNHQKLRPSLSLRGFGGRASFYYEDSRRTTKDHPGLPTTGTLDTRRFRIPDSRSINDPDVPPSRTTLRAYGFDGELPLTRYFTLTGAARRSESTVSQLSQYISSNTPDTDPSGMVAPSTFNRMVGTYVGNTTETQARARLTGRYAFDHLGKFTGWLGYSGEDAPDFVELRVGVATPLDVVNPRYGTYTGGPIPLSQANSNFQIRNLSSGLQWRYSDWLNLFGAFTDTDGRVRNRQTSVVPQLARDLLGEQAQALAEGLLFPILAGGPLAGTGLFVEREDRYQLNSRQFGAALRFWDAGSRVVDDGLWAFYGQGNGNQFRAYFTGEGQPKPELSNQREAGLRLVNRRWGRIETTAFRIQRRNVPTLDPNGVTGFEQVATGLQSVRGIDLETTLTIPYPVIDRFSFNGSAAWLNSRIDEDTTFASGNELADVPQRNYRVQLAAAVVRAPTPLRVFVARRCRSEVQGNLSNSFSVPGRCLNDAGATASYRGFSFDAVINNFSDTRYYEPYTYLFYGVIPGERRSARLAISYALGRSP